MTNTIYIHQPEKAFSFTRLPNFLFEAPTFKPLSNEAKVCLLYTSIDFAFLNVHGHIGYKIFAANGFCKLVRL